MTSFTRLIAWLFRASDGLLRLLECRLWLV